MKTLSISMIISAVALSTIAISIGIIQSQSNKQPTYQYEIHEPYDGVDKDFGIVTIQNQTFHTQNLNTLLRNSGNATEIEWYGIKFSFPNGSERMLTPGGDIFESYVTFQDDPVPYRIAVGQS